MNDERARKPEIIAKTTMPSGTVILTVAPVRTYGTYETTVHDYVEVGRARYWTLDDAQAGHAALVKKYGEKRVDTAREE